MLSYADNEVLTRTNAGTPMGETMRRYWMPALLSSEIPEPDCVPSAVNGFSRLRRCSTVCR